MRFEQTKDVLDHVRDFHHEASQFFQRVSAHINELSDDDSVEREQLLLDYLVEYQIRLQENTERYEEEAPDALLNTWFQYSDADGGLVWPSNDALSGIRSIDDILAVALELGDQLGAFYIDMANHASNVEVKELFQHMADTQTREKRNLSLSVSRFKDI